MSHKRAPEAVNRAIKVTRNDQCHMINITLVLAGGF